MVQRPNRNEMQLTMGQTTRFPSVPAFETAVVFGRGSTLTIRDQGVPAVAGDAGANERRYEVPVLDAVRRFFGGRTVTVREVFDTARIGLLRVPASALPSAYAVRDVLLILCAMGLATADATSAEPYFTIRSIREE
jgi:hypothetical protein